MERTIKANTEAGISVNTVLGSALACSIMVATGRFYLTQDGEDTMKFWDNDLEKEVSIIPKWTLGKLMQWIVNYYAEDFRWRGEQKAQRKMRNALGLD